METKLKNKFTKLKKHLDSYILDFLEEEELLLLLKLSKSFKNAIKNSDCFTSYYNNRKLILDYNSEKTSLLSLKHICKYLTDEFKQNKDIITTEYEKDKIDLRTTQSLISLLKKSMPNYSYFINFVELLGELNYKLANFVYDFMKSTRNRFKSFNAHLLSLVYHISESDIKELKIEKLFINKNFVKPENVDNFFKAINMFTNIKKLYIQRLSLNYNNKQFLNILTEHKQLEEVNLSGVFLSKSETLFFSRDFFSCFNLNTNIKILNLSANSINNEVAAELVEVFKINKSIEDLNLSHNLVTNIDIFIPLIELNTTLVKLILKNNLFESVTNNFCKALGQNKTLRILDLKNSYKNEYFYHYFSTNTIYLSKFLLDDKYSKIITSKDSKIECIKNLASCPNLNCLSFSNIIHKNFKTEEDFGIFLYDLVINSQTIETLKFKKSILDFPTENYKLFTLIMDTIRKSKSLKILIFKDVRFDFFHLIQLFIALSESSSSITTLSLEANMFQHNKYYPKDLQELNEKGLIVELLTLKMANFISLNTIKILDLSNCKITFKILKEKTLLSALQENKSLDELNLNNNFLTGKSCPYIRTILEGNKTLKILRLKNNGFEMDGCFDILTPLVEKVNETIELIDLSSNLISITCANEILKKMKWKVQLSRFVIIENTKDNYYAW